MAAPLLVAVLYTFPTTFVVVLPAYLRTSPLQGFSIFTPRFTAEFPLLNMAFTPHFTAEFPLLNVANVPAYLRTFTPRFPADYLARFLYLVPGFRHHLSPSTRKDDMKPQFRCIFSLFISASLHTYIRLHDQSASRVQKGANQAVQAVHLNEQLC